MKRLPRSCGRAHEQRGLLRAGVERTPGRGGLGRWAAGGDSLLRRLPEPPAGGRARRAGEPRARDRAEPAAGERARPGGGATAALRRLADDPGRRRRRRSEDRGARRERSAVRGMGPRGAAAGGGCHRVSGGMVSFAFVAGTVATVNPCGFALLPAYLARRVGVEDGTRRGADAVSRALLVGGVTTAGFMLVFGTIGTAIGLGARELTRALPWAGLVIGVALVLAGAAVLAGGHLRLRLPQLRQGSAGGGLRGDLLFGIGYGTASLSCTLPIFLAATGSAVTGSIAA